jgi:hypothetical protein
MGVNGITPVSTWVYEHMFIFCSYVPSDYTAVILTSMRNFITFQATSITYDYPH